MENVLRLLNSLNKIQEKKNTFLEGIREKIKEIIYIINLNKNHLDVLTSEVDNRINRLVDQVNKTQEKRIRPALKLETPSLSTINKRKLEGTVEP